MGFPKTIPTIPVPYKLRKKGLFETIDQANTADQAIQANTADQAIQANTADQAIQANTADQAIQANTADQAIQANTADQAIQANIIDHNNTDEIYETDDTFISSNIITLSLTWLAIATITYIYIKY
jgi:hypothetical protein